MSVGNFEELLSHVGHHVVVAKYINPIREEVVGVAIECVDCGMVLLDFDKDEEEE